VDEQPEERRSPSPEPLYNESGARTNTREQRAKDKLMRQRNVSRGWGCGESVGCGFCNQGLQMGRYVGCTPAVLLVAGFVWLERSVSIEGMLGALQ
jgi:hypothetical protein